MFKIFVAPPNFFSQILIGLLILVGFTQYVAWDALDLSTLMCIVMSMIAYGVNIAFINASILLKKSMYQLFLLGLFMNLGTEYLLIPEVCIAFLMISILNYLLNNEKLNQDRRIFIYLAVLLFIANVAFYPSFTYTLTVLFVILTYGLSWRAIQRFLFTYFILALSLFEILYLNDEAYRIQDYFCAIELGYPRLNWDWYYFIPLGVFIVLAWMDHFSNAISQSAKKRNYYNLYILLFTLQIVGLLVFTHQFDEQLLFLYFPISIFLGRYMMFIKNPFIQNILMILSLLSLVLIKVYNFDFI